MNGMKTILAAGVASGLLAVEPEYLGAPWVTLSIRNMSTRNLVRDHETWPSTVRVSSRT